MLEVSPNLIKAIVNKLTLLNNVNEGDLLTAIYLTDVLREVIPTKALDLSRKFIPMINNTRFSLKKRLYAIYASGKL
jgi:hypothetical protein